MHENRKPGRGCLPDFLTGVYKKELWRQCLLFPAQPCVFGRGLFLHGLDVREGGIDGLHVFLSKDLAVYVVPGQHDHDGNACQDTDQVGDGHQAVKGIGQRIGSVIRN